MSYRLDLAVGVPDALRGAAAEQLEDAIRVLREQREADPVTAVHEARKDLKKARSLLRLARTGMPGKERRGLDAALRDVAGELSAVRDADVMVETVDALHERFAGQLPARAFGTVRHRFAVAAQHSRAAADQAITGGVMTELGALVVGVADWRVDGCDTRTLREGATIAYERGRDRFAVARKDPTVENLHEWRKRVKDLWYHARLLEDAWPVTFRALAEEAHVLSDRLGDDHDLGVLADRIPEHTWPPSVDENALLDLVARRREELQEQSFGLGRRLYAERPKAFGRRIGAYLAASR